MFFNLDSDFQPLKALKLIGSPLMELTIQLFTDFPKFHGFMGLRKLTFTEGEKCPLLRFQDLKNQLQANPNLTQIIMPCCKIEQCEFDLAKQQLATQQLLSKKESFLSEQQRKYLFLQLTVLGTNPLVQTLTLKNY